MISTGVLALILFSRPLAAQVAPVAVEVPDQWIVDYPRVDKVAPPTTSAYADAELEVFRRGRVVYRTQRNGGFGRTANQGSVQIVHVGVDVGLLRVGSPVYAVANGIVRMSLGPPPPPRRRSSTEAPPKMMGMAWGNFVAIEHEFPDGKFYTSIYGHLDSRRLVEVGETVTAGQLLGKIGKQDVEINGGYIPHLHFGIRKGRMAEIGAAITYVPVDGKVYPLVLKEVGPINITVELDTSKEITVPAGVRIPDDGSAAEFQSGPTEISSKRLWMMRRPDFSLVGHTDRPEPWLDPLPFLRGYGATTHPARFHRRRTPLEKNVESADDSDKKDDAAADVKTSD